MCRSPRRGIQVLLRRVSHAQRAAAATAAAAATTTTYTTLPTTTPTAGQFEIGTDATSLEFRSDGWNFARCQLLSSGCRSSTLLKKLLYSAPYNANVQLYNIMKFE